MENLEIVVLDVVLVVVVAVVTFTPLTLLDQYSNTCCEPLSMVGSECVLNLIS